MVLMPHLQNVDTEWRQQQTTNDNDKQQWTTNDNNKWSTTTNNNNKRQWWTTMNNKRWQWTRNNNNKQQKQSYDDNEWKVQKDMFWCLWHVHLTQQYQRFQSLPGRAITLWTSDGPSLSARATLATKNKQRQQTKTMNNKQQLTNNKQQTTNNKCGY